MTKQRRDLYIIWNGKDIIELMNGVNGFIALHNADTEQPYGRYRCEGGVTYDPKEDQYLQVLVKEQSE